MPNQGLNASVRNIKYLFPSYASKILDAIPSIQGNNKTSNIKLNKAAYGDLNILSITFLLWHVPPNQSEIQWISRSYLVNKGINGQQSVKWNQIFGRFSYIYILL